MMADPHVLIEGVVITSFAIGCDHAFIYLRGEVVHVYRRLLRAVEEAYAKGYLGKNILGSGFDLDITVHAGAGAYICGEETALLDSLEGRRGQPRLKPPFPARRRPLRPADRRSTTSSRSPPCPAIIADGADWFTGMGTEKSTGFGIFSLSGHVKRPGQYEAPLGITLRELLDMAGGMRDPRQGPEVLDPGGSSTPMFTAEHLDVPLDFESVGAAGLDARHPRAADLRRDHLRGARRRPLDRLLRARVLRQVHPVPRGHLLDEADPATASSTAEGSEEDLDKLLDICDNILGRCFCALGDGATSPITSADPVLPRRVPAHLDARAAARSTRRPRRCSPRTRSDRMPA